MTVITDVLKPIAEMNVAELRIFLATPRIARFAESYNSKTRKADLITVARNAHLAAGIHEAKEAQAKRDAEDALTVFDETQPIVDSAKRSTNVTSADIDKHIGRFMVSKRKRHGKRYGKR